MEQTQNTPTVHTAFNPAIIIGSPTGAETSGELIINVNDEVITKKQDYFNSVAKFNLSNILKKKFRNEVVEVNPELNPNFNKLFLDRNLFVKYSTVVGASDDGWDIGERTALNAVIQNGANDLTSYIGKFLNEFPVLKRYDGYPLSVEFLSHDEDVTSIANESVNLYDKTNILLKLSEGGAIDKINDYEWLFTGDQYITPIVFRIANVINSNGWWTVSFDLRGAQGVSVGLDVDICDKSSIGGGVLTTTDNQYRRVSFTAYVNNHTSELYNFVDINCADWAWYYIRNIQIEKGHIATEYKPSFTDTIATTEALQSVISVPVLLSGNMLLYNNETLDNITDEITIENADCTPKQPFYIRWINRKAGRSYFMFSNRQIFSSGVKSQEIVPLYDDNEQLYDNVLIDLTGVEKVKAGAIVSNDDFDILSKIAYSPRIEWFNEELQDWVRIFIDSADNDKDTFSSQNEITFTFSLPEPKTQI